MILQTLLLFALALGGIRFSLGYILRNLDKHYPGEK